MSLAIDAVSAGFSIANTAATSQRSQMLNRRVARELDRSMWSLQPLYQATQVEHRERSGILGLQEGRSLFDVMRNYSSGMAKSGFDSSGALQMEASLGKQSIYDTFNEKRYDLEIQRQSQLNNLAAQERTLKIQRAALDTGTKGVWSASSNSDYEKYRYQQERQEYLSGTGEDGYGQYSFDDPYNDVEEPEITNVDENGNYVPVSEYEESLKAQGKTVSTGSIWDTFQNKLVVGAEKAVDAITNPLWQQQYRQRQAVAQQVASQVASRLRNSLPWR